MKSKIIQIDYRKKITGYFERFYYIEFIETIDYLFQIQKPLPALQLIFCCLDNLSHYYANPEPTKEDYKNEKQFNSWCNEFLISYLNEKSLRKEQKLDLSILWRLRNEMIHFNGSLYPQQYEKLNIQWIQNDDRHIIAGYDIKDKTNKILYINKQLMFDCFYKSIYKFFNYVINNQKFYDNFLKFSESIFGLELYKTNLYKEMKFLDKIKKS